MVMGLLILLVYYVIKGIPHVDNRHFDVFMKGDLKTLFMTAGLIFVSYGGLTKIASVAEEVKNPSKEYIAINTRFTLTVAAFALPEIAKYDKKANITASHIPNGKIQMRVLPNDPAVFLTVKDGVISATKGTTENPDAIMEMKDMQTANDFLNGKLNPFLAIASGDVIIWGITPMLDNLSLILDKVQNYV